MPKFASVRKKRLDIISGAPERAISRRFAYPPAPGGLTLRGEGDRTSGIQAGTTLRKLQTQRLGTKQRPLELPLRISCRSGVCGATGITEEEEEQSKIDKQDIIEEYV